MALELLANVAECEGRIVLTKGAEEQTRRWGWRKAFMFGRSWRAGQVLAFSDAASVPNQETSRQQ